MTVNQDDDRIPVSFRLSRELVERMRIVAAARRWPPPPSQTDIVNRGIELALAEYKRKSKRA